jgi:hypothetical protein
MVLDPDERLQGNGEVNAIFVILLANCQMLWVVGATVPMHTSSPTTSRRLKLRRLEGFHQRRDLGHPERIRVIINRRLQIDHVLQSHHHIAPTGSTATICPSNHAERELRAFVLWRKRSFGTRSERGNRFAERVMTVAHTARKQGRNVLEFLTAACKAKLDETPSPSLFALEPTA